MQKRDSTKIVVYPQQNKIIVTQNRITTEANSTCSDYTGVDVPTLRNEPLVEK